MACTALTVPTKDGQAIDICTQQDLAIAILAERYGVPREEMTFGESRWALDMIDCSIPAGDKLVNVTIAWDGAISV